MTGWHYELNNHNCLCCCTDGLHISRQHATPSYLNNLEAERDRYREALREIVEQGVDSVQLDDRVYSPEHIARAALEGRPE